MNLRLLCLTWILSAFILGCSSSRNSIPTSQPIDTIPNKLAVIPVGVTDWDSSGNPSEGFGALGFFHAYIDTNSLKGELIPLRNSSLVDVLEVVDITHFLQLAPCTNCAKIMSVELDTENHLHVKIGIKHPFAPGDPLKPISGKNRADLHVFNVEGIVISDGTEVKTFPSLGKTIGLVGLVNADGYTGYLDEALNTIFETQANLHPYILHFDDYSAGNFNPSNPMGFESVTEPPPYGNLVMAMGCDYDVKDYIFDLNGNIEFLYAVGCTYAVSAATKAERFSPQYRIPQHNKKAASEVSVAIINNELEDGDETSFAELEIRVVDINHGVPVGSSLNQMFADSSVREVSVEVSGVTTSSVSFGNNPVSGTGHNPSDPLIFRGKIYNTAQAPEGSYIGLVKVLDNYNPGLNGAPLLQGKDGIKRVSPLVNPLEGLFQISEFATYMTFIVTVEIRNELPTCSITACGGTTPSVNLGGHLRLDGSSSSDIDGSIISYEWDLNYDGVNFDVDATGTRAWFEGTSAGTFTIALRVTDDNNGQSICTKQISCTGNPRGWLTPVRVTTTPDNYYDRIQCPNKSAVAITDDCIVHLAYFTWKTSYPYERDVLYTKFDGSSWSTPEHIYDFDNSYVLSVALVADSKNKLHIAFCISNQMWYANNTSGTWNVQTVDTGGSAYSFENISLAINSDDQMLIAADDSNWILNVQYMSTYFNNGSGFGPRMQTSEHCKRRSETTGIVDEPELSVTPDGHFHLIYNGLRYPPCPASDWNREVYHSEFDGNTWIDYGIISNLGPDCHQPRAFSDLNGNLYCAVWAGGSLYYAKRDAITKTWSNFEVIVGPTNAGYQPDLEIDRWGRAYLVWYSTGYYSYFKTFMANDSIANILATPAQQVPLGGGGQNAFPHIKLDFDGDAHIVYEDRTLGEWTNTELYYVCYH